MSGGFLPDLANWALRGGAGDNDPNDNDENNEIDTGNIAGGDGQTQEPLSEAEVRARRLARMGAAMSAAAQPEEIAQQQQPVPMDIDKEEDNEKKKNSKTDASPPRKKSLPFVKKSSPSSNQPGSNQDQHHQTKKAKESHSSNSNSGNSSAADAARKAQRRKELLLKKVLSLSLAGTCTAMDTSCVVLELDDTTITVQTIAEVLATRLSLSPDSALLKTIPLQKPLLAYLAQCHRRASDELKSLKQTTSSSGSGKKDKDRNAELEEILEEIKRQVVSYAASSLMEPDLFELAKDGSTQLAKALLNTGDPTSSITFGVAGTSTSFYYCLCEELEAQDNATFYKVIQQVATYLMSHLSKCESVDGGAGETSALGLVVALNSMIVHKRAAHAVSEMDKFLVPEANTAAANEIVRPTAPTPQNFLSMLAGENRPYKRRSGPAIEKDTLLGQCLRVGTPQNNPAFSPSTILRQSLDSVERATKQQRQQLRVYQEALNQLILAFVKSGVEPRGKVRKCFFKTPISRKGPIWRTGPI